MPYFDIMVAAVPTAGKDAYQAHAQKVAQILRECGAESSMDTWGDDVPDGTTTDFKRAVQAKPDETVAVGWVVWPDKEARDAGWEKMMKDDRMTAAGMPFDGKRMIFGGFDLLHQG